jgi:DNA-binding transcriptional MerR regulator
MPGARSYSLSELVEATGFDRRTIVYYIQSGLLPKVGRRGPHTRYPDECLVRLLFIKGVRTLQAEGQLLTATLAEMRRALGARDASRIRDLLDRGLPAEELTALFAEEPPVVPPPVVAGPTPVTGPSGERRSYGLADAGSRKRLGGDRPTTPPTPEIHHEETHPGLPVLDPAAFQPSAVAPAPAAAESSLAETELGELLRELEVRPTLNARRSPPGSPEQWTEIPITSRVYLSVRGLSAEDAPLAEAVARLLKRALRARSSPTPA